MTTPVAVASKKSKAPIFILIAAIAVVCVMGFCVVSGLVIYALSGGNHYAANIERVLAADRGTSQGAASVEDVVARMRAIDLDGCPDDFKSAYIDHIHAWETMIPVMQEAKAYNDQSLIGISVESFVRGALGDPLGKYNELKEGQTQIQRDYQASSQQIQSTFHHVEDVAVKHGASVARK